MSTITEEEQFDGYKHFNVSLNIKSNNCTNKTTYLGTSLAINWHWETKRNALKSMLCTGNPPGALIYFFPMFNIFF